MSTRIDLRAVRAAAARRLREALRSPQAIACRGFQARGGKGVGGKGGT